MRTLLVLCLASLFWSFTFGAGAPLASLWLQDAGSSATLIGVNTGVYYLGIALASALVPWMIRRWGSGCMIFGMVASGVTVAGFPFTHSIFGWFVLRALNGAAGAMSLVPLETLVNHNSPPEKRSRDFGYYAFCVALGIALGTLTGTQIYASLPRLAFIVGGAAGPGAALIVAGWLQWPGIPAEARHARTPLAFCRNFLSFGSAWGQGFLEGGMVALMPVFLLAIGLTDKGVGWLMSAIMLGVIVSQVPIAWLADRLGRLTVLLACYGVTLGVLAAVIMGIPLAGLTVCLFFAGACSSAFYPLGLAMLGERTPPSGLPRASAWYLSINCIGSLVGPIVSGAVMDELGKQMLFAAGEGAVLLVLLIWATLRLVDFNRRRHDLDARSPISIETRHAA
jgi:MFS family permease